ncbi:MAG: phosphate ABC transporter ATP-binding protein [Thermoguttaceae bacterium]|jgi:phosphate transport system ATP-binding protein
MNVHIRFEQVSVSYAGKPALRDVTLDVFEKQILGIIGPANSGKTTLLKCINRTIDFATSARTTGKLLVGGEDVLRTRNVYGLRRRVGMVFPLPVGLPLSIYENVAYAPRRAGLHERAELDALVEHCLRQAMLWDEVCDRLDMLGTRLSGGQQQRLTLARALSHRPEVLCLDEFSIAIDPVTTMKIEDVLLDLKEQMTIVLVTNLVQQARRLADRTAFFSDSRLIEVADTETLFTHPDHRLTERYVNGDFG